MESGFPICRDSPQTNKEADVPTTVEETDHL